MADNSRIDDLRRRVQKDPASIAFAQLGEECRRAGQAQEAVDICRAGLAIHPEYLSARVTLGRALLEANDLDGALAELERVLKSAPENLAALRAFAETHHKLGHRAEALVQYQAALLIARNDPDLQRTL
jgi:tetratricopeptide (TPR) repeat protein